MKKYDKYKDSGIEWIGEIPEHWEIVKMKYHCTWEKGRNAALYTNEYIANNFGEYPVYSGQTENEGVLGTIASNDYNFEYFALLVSTVGAKAMTLRKLTGKFSLSQNCAIISSRNKDYFNINFGFYYVEQLFNYEKGLISLIMQPSLRFEDLNTFSLVKPYTSEQTAIANYLDRKTAEIDELIADKKHLLELYEEEKTAIINQAVTKGINPSVKMKDSGIEWLGDIPEHWEVKRLKYIGNLRSGSNIVSEQIKETGEFPVYGGNGQRGFFNEFTHDGNFILIGRQGAYCGNIKYGKGKFWASEHAVVVSPLVEYEEVYIGELLRVMNLNKHSVSAAQPGLAVEMIKNLQITFPPLFEQESIVNHIETECTRIEAKKVRTQKLIELLTEYRTALISEVVTGKVKVISDFKTT